MLVDTFYHFLEIVKSINSQINRNHKRIPRKQNNNVTTQNQRRDIWAEWAEAIGFVPDSVCGRHPSVLVTGMHYRTAYMTPKLFLTKES